MNLQSISVVVAILVVIGFVIQNKMLKGGFKCQNLFDLIVPGKKQTIWTAENLHGYENLCLTGTKPIGSPGTAPVYRQWENREAHWQVEYGPENVDVNMDRVQKYTSDLTNSAASYKPLTKIDDRFYHNPERFCKSKPNDHPCPNSWIKDPQNFSGTLSYHSDNMCDAPITALNEPDFRHRPEFCVKDETYAQDIITRII